MASVFGVKKKNGLLMTIEKIYSQRKQARIYQKQIYPDAKLVDTLLDKAFSLTASKKNIVPYEIHILGPGNDRPKEILYALSQWHKDNNNTNIFAPYVLLFTSRLAYPSPRVIKEMREKNAIGVPYPSCSPQHYNTDIDNISNACIEIGIFCNILTGLCIENNIDTSYLSTFPKTNEYEHIWKQLPLKGERLLFSMQLGYKSMESKNLLYPKPDVGEVIRWV